MESKGLRVFRYIVLAFSFVIVTVAMFLFEDTSNMADEHIFMWVVIYLITAAIFIPTLFPPKVANNSAGAIIGLALLYTGAIPFTLCSIGLIFLALYKTLKVAILLEVIFVFIFVLRFFFVFLIGNKTGSVEIKEKQMLSKIKELRSYSLVLETKINSLGENFADNKKLFNSICEDLRYLSPVNNQFANSLEQNIYDELNNVDSKLAVAGTNVNNVELNNDLNKIKQLITQRKSILN